MLEGKCSNCGACYYGWALKNPEHKTCLNCSTALEIGEFDGYIPTDNSPSTVDLKVKNPPGDSAHLEPNDWEDDMND
jgi:hypothetical protein